MVIRFIYVLIFRYKTKIDRWMIKIDEYEAIKHKFCLIELDLKYSMRHGQR